MAGVRARGPKFLLVVVALLAGLYLLSMRKAPTPEVFAQNYTLQDASARSADSGMPVFVLATADWCPACQSLKRGALTKAGVAQWLSENTHPVYLDTDKNPAEAQAMQVEYLPTMLLLRNGKEVARLTGAAGEKELLEWLAHHSGPVADAKASGREVPPQ